MNKSTVLPIVFYFAFAVCGVAWAFAQPSMRQGIVGVWWQSEPDWMLWGVCVLERGCGIKFEALPGPVAEKDQKKHFTQVEALQNCVSLQLISYGIEYRHAVPE